MGYYYEKLLMLGKIRDAMMDEKSRILFDAKIDYMITRDSDQFYRISDALEREWYCNELNDILETVSVKGIIIFGCGHDGIRTKKIMENCNYYPQFFCDSNNEKTGAIVDGLKVIAFNKLIQEYRDYLVVLGSAQYAEEMYKLLQTEKFPIEKVLYPQYKLLFAKCGNQYFDVFYPEEKEVFVDGGGYNGNTVLDFISWTEGKFGKVYSFEPTAEMSKIIRERIREEQVKDVVVYEYALWNRNENLCFWEDGSGSRVEKLGELMVKGIPLDDVVQNEKISFIKLDVEGSELAALEGAKNTITKYRPKLAICIYHKPEDILEIPAYILELVPEYKFYIRHYTSFIWETVLYAEVPK